MPSTDPSTAALWVGRVLSGVAVLFLLFDAAGKIAKVGAVVEGSQKLGYPAASVQGIGVALLICTLIYAFPKTAVLGAVLLTGYLGGAVATHVRVANPWLTHTLFPIYVAVFVWGGLYLRLPQVASIALWMK